MQLLPTMRIIINMRLFISCFLMLVFSLSLTQAQDTESIADFKATLKVEFPDFKFFYLNENQRIFSFIITDDAVLLMDFKSRTGSDFHSHFFFLDRESMIIKDTLVFEGVTPDIFRPNLFFDTKSNSLIFRPLSGRMGYYGVKSFFNSLSLEIGIEANGFGEVQVKQDGNNIDENLILKILDKDVFDVYSTKKEFGVNLEKIFKVNYQMKDQNFPNVFKRSLKYFNFPNTITTKEFLMLDLSGGMLLQTDLDIVKKSIVKLPDSTTYAKYSELLFDQVVERIYLRLTFENRESIYQLYKNEFIQLDFKLPQARSYTGIISKRRQIYIHDGRLYVMFSFKEGDQEFDAIFYREL